MDSSGVSRSIECDDHEALLVGVWVRTGCWLQPHLLSRFEVELQGEDEPEWKVTSTSHVLCDDAHTQI